jgi:hypothetical protein
MLTFKQFCALYPDLAQFNDTYTRRSSLNKVYLVRKNRWGNSEARMHDRRGKIKRSLKTLINTGRVSANANPNLLSLNLKNIPNRGQRRAYALVVKKAARGLGKVI